MDNNQDLKYIKKHYGEHFERLCRRLFPTILEEPGKLTEIISKHFDTTSTLFYDILDNEYEFQQYILCLYEKDKRRIEQQKNHKDPEELFKEAGYTLYPECMTFEDILKFKKYYAKNETICTFEDNRRLQSCRVWFALKDNIDDIKRENFQSPKREDEYGTSVISIQVSKGLSSTLSIKNRYNHRVDNPDATFSNDLDNIIPGLSAAFFEKFDIDITKDDIKDFRIPGYVHANDGKFYRINIELDNSTKICENNIVVDLYGDVTKYDKSKYLFIDGYFIDLQNKNVCSMAKNDCFWDCVGEIENIDIHIDDKKNRVIDITPKVGEKIKIVSNKAGEIIKYSNPNLIKIADNFMWLNKELHVLDLPNVEEIGNDFLAENTRLEEINFPKLKKISNNFLESNNIITEINLPNVEEVGNDFLHSSMYVCEANMPKLKTAGDFFFYNDEYIENIDFPNLEKIGNGFFTYNEGVKTINLPKVKEIGDDFLFCAAKIEELCLPKVEKIGNGFMRYNNSLKKLDLPEVRKIKVNFLYNNKCLKEINIPKINCVGKAFMCTHTLEGLNLPEVEESDDWRYRSYIK